MRDIVENIYIMDFTITLGIVAIEKDPGSCVGGYIIVTDTDTPETAMVSQRLNVNPLHLVLQNSIVPY
jgi:hypothetical protein